MTSPNEKQRVIPARVYDAIEAQAEIHGGVGLGSMYRYGAPVCGIGLAHAGGAFPEVGQIDTDEFDDAIDALYDVALSGAAGFGWSESDDAVADAVDRLLNREEINCRVPFDAWIKELGAVRGDDQ